MKLRSDFEEERLVRVAIYGHQIDTMGRIDFEAAIQIRSNLTAREEEALIREAKARGSSLSAKATNAPECKCGTRRTRGGAWYVVDGKNLMCGTCANHIADDRREEFVA